MDEGSAAVFDPSLKKKKKKSSKSVAFATEDSEGAPVVSPVAEEGVQEMETSMENMFLDLKKKKKKKKSAAADGGDADKDESSKQEDDGEAGSSDEAVGPGGDFMGLKKKKKKKPVAADSSEEQLTPVVGDDDDSLMAEEGSLEGEEEIAAGDASSGITAEKFTDLPQTSDRDYTYNELLGRVFHIIQVNNPEYAGEKRKYTMVPPQVAREGSKKTVFVNIQDICRRMRRQPEHLVAFLFAELGTQGSMDGGGRLVIKGRFQQKQMENVLKRYILEYVTCKTCKSPDTHLARENRLFFLKCESCGSARAVTAIKSGFRAQTEKRRKQA